MTWPMPFISDPCSRNDREAVERILCNATAQGGVFAPGALFDAKDFLATLTPDALS